MVVLPVPPVVENAEILPKNLSATSRISPQAFQHSGTELRPSWRCFWPWFGPIEDFIHIGKEPSCKLVACDEFYDQFMGEGPGVTPGAYPHADIAIRSDLSPVIKTGFIIKLPAECTVHHLLFSLGYGVGRAAHSTFLADFTEIFYSKIHRFVSDKGKIRGHRTQSHSRAELLCH